MQGLEEPITVMLLSFHCQSFANDMSIFNLSDNGVVLVPWKLCPLHEQVASASQPTYSSDSCTDSRDQTPDRSLSEPAKEVPAWNDPLSGKDGGANDYQTMWLPKRDSGSSPHPSPCRADGCPSLMMLDATHRRRGTEGDGGEWQSGRWKWANIHKCTSRQVLLLR